MHEEHGFNVLHYLPFFKDLPSHVGMTILVGGLLIATTFVARGQLIQVMRSPGGGLIPDEKMTYRNFF